MMLEIFFGDKNCPFLTLIIFPVLPAAAGKTGKIINVKKGQFLSPKKISNIIEKIESTGNKNILITERGSSFGLDSLVVDMKSIPLMH